MDTKKPLEFSATAGSYFLLTLITGFLTYVPIFGWAFLLNYTGGWLAQYSLVNGRKVTFKASYSETLKFTLISSLLMLVTFGIYVFWFIPKLYRYTVGHMHYEDVAALATDPTAANSPVPPVAPINPVQPPAATPPVTG